MSQRANPSAPDSLARAHSRFARAALSIYAGAACVAVSLLVGAVVTDRDQNERQLEEQLVLETELRASHLEQRLTSMADQLHRLGQRREVDLLDSNMQPEKHLLELAHSVSAAFNVGLALVDESGRVQWAQPSEFLKTGSDLVNRRWFQEARTTDSVRIFVVHSPPNPPALYLVSPIVREQRFTGALVAAIDLSRDFGPRDDALPELFSLLAAEGELIYPVAPPHDSREALSRAVYPVVANASRVTTRNLNGEPIVLTATSIVGGRFELVSFVPRRALLANANARLRTRLLVGLGLALCPLLGLLYFLRRSMREFAVSERQAWIDDRLRRLGEASSAIAHEVRNSLNGLRIGIDMLARRTNDPQSSIFRELQAQIKHLTDFTYDLMLFAKHPAPRCSPTDLSELVASTLALTTDLAAELGIQLKLVGIERPHLVPIDSELVRIALTNLVSNGMDALQRSVSEGEPPTLTVDIQEENLGFSIRVIDNGPGVSPNLRDRLFEPFVSGKPSGVGIGLALSRKLIQAHGGTLTLVAADQGAAFRIWLPLQSPPLERPPSLLR